MIRLVASLAVVAIAATAAAAEPLTLTIDQAVARVEGASSTLAASRDDLARAGADVDAARAGRLPQVSANASYTRTLLSEYSGTAFGDLPFGQRNVWRVGVNAVQPIWDGGRTAAAIAQARSGVTATKLSIASQRTALVYAVAQAYWDAALATRAVEIGQEGLTSADEALQQIQLAFAQQSAAEFDVVRAQVARDNQATGLIQLAAQRDIAMLALARLIDAPLGEPIALVTPLEADDAAAVAAAVRTGAALDGAVPSVVVAQAEADVAAREVAVRAARVARLPQISASTDLGLVDYAEDVHPFNADWRVNWTVGVGLSVPLFDGFRLQANARAAKRAVSASRSRLADVRERVDVERRVIDAQLAAASATWEQSRRTVEQAQRAFAIAELRFAQGASTHLELVDARTQLQQAELNRARSARDVRVATLRRDLQAGLPLGAGGP